MITKDFIVRCKSVVEEKVEPTPAEISDYNFMAA